MFASPGNHKFPLFCARYPHWKAKKVDALTCPLDDVQFCYSNTPWNLITQWLSRLRDHPHLTCWVIVPFWASAPWWPLLTRLQVPKSPCYKVLPFPGMVTNCVNRVMPPPVAPLLSDVIRAALQGRQVPLEGQDHYIRKLGDLRRYQSAINAFWQQCISVSPDPFSLSLDAIASQLLLLHDRSPAQARSAYSAPLLVPGLEHLRFSSLLKVCKRQWSASQPKYSVFWSAGRVVKLLAHQRLNWDSVEQVRDRLILCWRLFGLHRSIDLARLYRKVSFVNRRPFVVIDRKGWPDPRWEEVLCFSDRSLSP